MDIFQSIVPRTLNGVLMWVISFLMLSILIRKRSGLFKKKISFFYSYDNFIVGLSFLLTLLSFIINVFFLSNANAIEAPNHVLIPSTVYSIILSVIALGVFLSSLIYYFRNVKGLQFSKLLYSILILLLFFGLQKTNYLISIPIPYDVLVFSVINLIIEIIIFGVLLPFIFASLIFLSIKLIKKDEK